MAAVAPAVEASVDIEGLAGSPDPINGVREEEAGCRIGDVWTPAPAEPPMTVGRSAGGEDGFA